MKALRVVFRLALLITLGIEIPGLPTSAQTTSPKESQPPAPGLRKLTGDDAKRAEELDKAIEAALKADRWDEAIARAEELLALRTRAQGPKHFETVNAEWRLKTLRRVAPMPQEDRVAYQSARTMNEQAETLTAQGKYAQAQPLFEKALEIRRRLLTDDHPDTAESYNNVADNLNAQGKYAQAQPLYEKALEISRRLLTDDHPDTADSYNNLAFNLNAQGKYAQAQPLYEKALEIHRRLLTDDHPDTAYSYNNVATNLNAQGKYAQAQPLYEKALEIYRRLLTDNHPDTASSYNSLAFNLNAQGKYAQAQPLYEKALEIHRRLLTDDHPDTASSYNNLASNLKAQGKYAQAQPLYEKALEISRRLLTDDHPDTADELQRRGGQPQGPGEVRPGPAAVSRRRWRSAAACSPTTTPTPPRATTTWRPTSTPRGSTPRPSRCTRRRWRSAAACSPTTTPTPPPATTTWRPTSTPRGSTPRPSRSSRRRWRSTAACSPTTTPTPPSATTTWRPTSTPRGSTSRRATNGCERSRAWTRPGSGSPSPAWNAPADRGVQRPALAAVLARLGQPAEAWQSLEEDLGRGLLDELAARQDRRLSPAERARLRELTAALEQLDRLVETTPKDLDQAERAKRFEELKHQRELASIALGEFQTKLVQDYGALAGQVARLNEIQAALPADAALVAWVDIAPAGPNAADPDGEHWGVVVRSRGIPAWVPIAGTGPDGLWTKDDTGLADRVRTELRRRPGAGSADLRPLVERLRTQRLEPLAKALGASADGLPPARRLIVLPSPAMAGIPVEALLALDDTRTVSYAPSATVLFKYLREQPRPDRHAGLLALGDPVCSAPLAGYAIRGRGDGQAVQIRRSADPGSAQGPRERDRARPPGRLGRAGEIRLHPPGDPRRDR